MTSQTHALAFVLGTIVLCGCGIDSTPGSSRSDAVMPPQPQADHAPEVSSFYTVATYDPEANPAEDLIRTISLASTSGKRIILEIGGDW